MHVLGTLYFCRFAVYSKEAVWRLGILFHSTLIWVRVSVIFPWCLTRRAVDMKEVQDFKMEMKGRPE